MVKEATGPLGPAPLEDAPRRGVWRRVVVTCLWFPLAYLIFAVVGVITSVGALVLASVLPARLGRPLGQNLIHRLFAFFVWYLRVTGLAQFDFHQLESLPDWRGGIIAANHPCLLDVVFLVSRLPRVFCLMKASVLSNVVLCGTARLAGYVDNHSARGMVRQCVARIRAGETLVIFPEGTRTVARGVNDFKLGFALVAKLAAAPVQTVFIEPDSGFLGKRWPFLKPPQSFPVRYNIRLGERFQPSAGTDAKALGREIEEYFRVALAAREGCAAGGA